MLNSKILEKALLEIHPGLNIKLNESMSKHCSFRIGGTVSMLVKPSSVEELTDTIAFFKTNDIKYKVIGLATNLLISDEHLDMAIIQTTNMCDASVNGDILTADCGCSMAKAALTAYNEGLTGFEFAHGIPGTIGGGIYMNAGAYGGEIAHVLISSKHIDENGNICDMELSEHNFAYRTSFFVDNPGKTIISAKFRLTYGNKDEIKNKMDDLHNRRKDKQPLEFPSAGSSFKRPEGHFAGALIEDCGLKGYSVGGAQVSEKHAGFIINTGNATCDDVLKLVDHIKNEVYKKYGIMLECEPELLR